MGGHGKADLPRPLYQIAESLIPMPFILHQKDSTTAARLGSLELPHGRVPTPIFMPVGTQGSVKTMHPQDLEMLGAEIILGHEANGRITQIFLLEPPYFDGFRRVPGLVPCQAP